jgi:hypothetical protein
MAPEAQASRSNRSASPSVRRDSNSPERRILNSWKEIAAYLGRGVRTVQRWEIQLELPVHRPAGKEHSAVIAFSPELDEWLNSRPVRHISGNVSQISDAAIIPSNGLQQIELKVETILLKIEALASQVDELSQQLNSTLENNRYTPEKPKLKVGHRTEAGAA